MQRGRTFSDACPQLFFTVKLFEMVGQFNLSGAYVPKEYSKGVYVNTGIVSAREEFWCHVDRRTDDTSGHHGFRYAESKIC